MAREYAHPGITMRLSTHYFRLLVDRSTRKRWQATSSIPLWAQSNLRRGSRRQAGLNPSLYRTVHRGDGIGGSCASRARASDGHRDRPRVVAEDLVRDARLRELRRQGRRLLPERGQVQLPLLDPGLPGRGEPRRRRRVAGVVRAEEVEPHGGEEGHRAGEGRDLLTAAATAAARPHRPWVQRLRAAPPQPRCHDLPCHSSDRSLASSHGGTTAPTQERANFVDEVEGTRSRPGLLNPVAFGFL